MIFTCKECDQVSDYSQVTSDMREVGCCIYCYEEMKDEVMESSTSLEEALDNIGALIDKSFPQLTIIKK